MGNLVLYYDTCGQLINMSSKIDFNLDEFISSFEIYKNTEKTFQHSINKMKLETIYDTHNLPTTIILKSKY